MPTSTYLALATLTLSGNDSLVEFASIPNTYRDLVLVCSFRAVNSSGLTYPSFRFNNDSGSNYPTIGMFANSASANGTSQSFGRIGMGGNTSTSFGHFVTMNIFDYSVTDKHKTFTANENHYGTSMVQWAGRWASTSVISSIQVFLEDNSNMASGSSFTLYGIVS